MSCISFFNNSKLTLRKQSFNTGTFTRATLKKRSLNLLLVVTLTAVFSARAFSQNSDRQEYIEKYASTAYFEMLEFGIPASITLAQGILESGNGKSELADKSNNHFGIKCHSDWTGPRVYHDDDEKGECFRKYKHPSESFRDHSLFLKNGSRYRSLFDLEPTDYKGWARGLKSAGYATSPTYADRLIAIIEEEELHKYDDRNYFSETTRDPQITAGNVPKSAKKRFLAHRATQGLVGVWHIVLLQGETLEQVADSMNVPIRKLLEWNDLTYESVVGAGERVYVQQKRRNGQDKTYKVQSGDRLRDIAQQKGIRLERLYKINGFPVGFQPQAGQTIRLRPYGWFEDRP